MRYGGYQKPAPYQRRFSYGNYSSVELPYPMTQTCRTTHDLSLVAANASPVFVQAPAENDFTGFAIDFLMGGVSAAVSKTAAAPIERVQLLIQNEDYFLIKPDCQRIPGNPTTSFSVFAILDGHNGIWAAIFAKENLLNNIMSVISQGIGRQEWLQALPRALVAGFVKIDIEFQQKGEIICALLWQI